MICKHCGARANEGEARCARCGRKPDDSLNGVFVAPRTKGALAPKLQLGESTESAEIAAPILQASSRGRESATRSAGARTMQASLFTEKPACSVIPIKGYAQEPVGLIPRPARDVHAPPGRR